ncbi:hypothetical protein F7P69_03760 [Cellulosimicrobium funkei]|nr:hypothetical protein [Cellulosimicrobium funkei]
MPKDLSAERQSRLLTVRLIADGVWFADAAGVFAPDQEERVRIRAVAEALLVEVDSEPA